MAKTIIFDMGGVLVHLDWEQVCAPLAGLSAKNAASVRREVVNGPIVKTAMTGQVGPEGFHAALCERLEIELPYQDFLRIWVRLLRANGEIVPLVERLKPVHSLVLASNTDPIHYTYSNQHFEVLGHFEQRFLSYELGLLKPEPAFFRHVLGSLGVEADDCVFIDDSLENVESARGVGMTALHFTGYQNLQSSLTAIL